MGILSAPLVDLFWETTVTNKLLIREYVEEILIESLTFQPIKFKDIEAGMSIVIWLCNKNPGLFSNEESKAVGSFHKRCLVVVVQTDQKDRFSLNLVSPGTQWGYLEYFKKNVDDIFQQVVV